MCRKSCVAAVPVGRPKLPTCSVQRVWRQVRGGRRERNRGRGWVDGVQEGEGFGGSSSHQIPASFLDLQCGSTRPPSVIQLVEVQRDTLPAPWFTQKPSWTLPGFNSSGLQQLFSLFPAYRGYQDPRTLHPPGSATVRLVKEIKPHSIFACSSVTLGNKLLPSPFPQLCLIYSLSVLCLSTIL